jgi:predicted ATPase/class 3 adenylate cyclase
MPQPSPTLTFLFADLESSTRLWERFPGAMKDAMERHDDILRRAVEGATGTVVKTTGDGLMAVFSSACDAVDAALRAQRGLREERWGETGPLRTRMGLHSGEAQVRGGDYFGSPVYRAARIMAAAHGEQVLLSELTATLAREGGLPAGAELRDLGEHRLKDLLQPERVHQLLHTDLPSDFPPLATLGHRPNNLPTQTSELVGRDEELTTIRGHLDAAAVRLITLTGPGGIGKTRLALQAAADQIDRFEDGVFFVNLAAARDTDAVLQAIVRALAVTATGQAQVAEMLKEQLRSRRLLLVLDNFEQVIEAAESVADLLYHCPELKILVTSREALRVRGEKLFPVKPLSLPVDLSPASAADVADFEAVRLLVERAQDAHPDFALTDANAAAMAEIAVRLDGLPLAIELAAARLRLFSPEELRDRLRSRLQLLRGGARDLPERQRTLRSTIEWSDELLDAEERAVFQLLSLFATARVEAVEEVAARVDRLREVDLLDRLTSLVDKSLVRSVESPTGQRLSMLGTIRDYAAERLEQDPELDGTARRAHGEYFAEFASARRDEVAGPHRQAALDALTAELGNLQSAWRHWVDAGEIGQLNRLVDALWLLHDARGWYHGTVQLIDDLLGVLSSAPAAPERTEEEITLRLSVGRCLLAIRGYTEEVEEMYRGALALADSLSALPRRFPILRSLASFHLYRGEYDKTIGIGRQILELGEQENDARLQVEGHLLLGPGTAFLGDVAGGLDHLDRSIALFDPQRHASARFRLGPIPGVPAHAISALLNWLVGNLDTADARATAAVELARQLDHPYSVAYAAFHVGVLGVWRRRPDLANERASEVLAVADEHDYPIWRALGHVLEGVTRAQLGSPDVGLARLEHGIALYHGVTTPPVFWPLILGMRAEVHAVAGQPQRALSLLDEAMALGGSEPSPIGPLLIVQRGDLLGALDDGQEAGSWFGTALEMARRLELRMPQLRAATRLARLESGPTRIEDLRRVLATFSEGLDEPDLVDARAAIEESASPRRTAGG